MEACALFWLLWSHCWCPLLWGKQVIFCFTYFVDCNWAEFSNWVCQKNWHKLKMSLLFSMAGLSLEASGRPTVGGVSLQSPPSFPGFQDLFILWGATPHHEHPLLSSATHICACPPPAISLLCLPVSFKSVQPSLRNVLEASRSPTRCSTDRRPGLQPSSWTHHSYIPSLLLQLSACGLERLPLCRA